MKIERATFNHLSDVANLFNDYRVFYRQPSDVKSSEAFIQERLWKEDSVILVATTGDSGWESGYGDNDNENVLLGFAQLYPSFSSVSMKRLYVLNDLYVCADARKQGIGTALLQHAQSFAADESECKGLVLATAKDNVAAQRLYEQVGFERDEVFFHYGWNVPSSSDLN